MRYIYINTEKPTITRDEIDYKKVLSLIYDDIETDVNKTASFNIRIECLKRNGWVSLGLHKIIEHRAN